MTHLERSVVAALVLTGLFLGREAVGSDSEPDGWVVVLLLDRSPSVASKARDGKYLVEEYAAKLRDQITGWARFQDVPLYFTSANFGNRIGESLPLVRVDSDVAPPLPKREIVPYTDFRVAFAYAQQVSEQAAKHGRLLVLLVTDAEPWISGSRMTQDQKEKYFRSTESLGQARHLSLAGATRAIQKAKGAVMVVAIGDLADDARLWRRYVPHSHYISTMETPDPLGQVRYILAGLMYESPGNKVHGSPEEEDAEKAVQPVVAEDIWRWVGVGGGALILGVLLFLAFKPPGGAGGPEGLKALEQQAKSLTQKADALSQSESEVTRAQAKGFYEAAITKGEALLKEGQALGNEMEARGIRVMSDAASGLFSNCAKTPVEARIIIGEMLENGSRERARGIAPALVERWRGAPQLLLEEFDLFRMTPFGRALLDGLADLASEEQDGFVKSVGSFARSALQLAIMVGG